MVKGVNEPLNIVVADRLIQIGAAPLATSRRLRVHGKATGAKLRQHLTSPPAHCKEQGGSGLRMESQLAISANPTHNAAVSQV
jgi:hypothetical protein